MCGRRRDVQRGDARPGGACAERPRRPPPHLPRPEARADRPAHRNHPCRLTSVTLTCNTIRLTSVTLTCNTIRLTSVTLTYTTIRSVFLRGGHPRGGRESPGGKGGGGLIFGRRNFFLQRNQCSKWNKISASTRVVPSRWTISSSIVMARPPRLTHTNPIVSSIVIT